MTEVVVFAGPSACDIPRHAGVTWLPPVRRGDVASLVERSAEPGTVVVCDGVFGGHPAVSHAELCDAIDAGWQVWGVSSIGAIRAYEMRHDGMHGFGYVYRQFARFADFTDDEMCLLHVPDPPYFPVTEALVNLRYALEQRQVAWRISDASAAVLLERLRAMWFGHRTAERMRQVMVEEAGIDAMAADALLAWTRDNRVKALDLAAILAARPWQLSPRAPAP